MHAEIGGLIKLNTDKVSIVETPLVRKINPWYAGRGCSSHQFWFSVSLDSVAVSIMRCKQKEVAGCLQCNRVLCKQWTRQLGTATPG